MFTLFIWLVGIVFGVYALRKNVKAYPKQWDEAYAIVAFAIWIPIIVPYINLIVGMVLFLFAVHANSSAKDLLQKLLRIKEGKK